MKTLKLICLILFASLLMSCAGGGTRGTGIGSVRIITGTIRLEDETPVINAIVTIIETGESDITDDNGQFEIETMSELRNLNLQIQNDQIDTTVEVNNIDDETNNLELNISIETQNNIGSISVLEVWARIVGACDAFFENRPRIRQSVATPGDGIDCTVKFFASGDGQRLERVPATIEVKSCDSNNWRRIAVGETGFGLNAGVGQIEFKFLDNKENCLYRIQAPVEIPGVKPVKVFIDTFTYQNLQ